jgi:cytochrome c oxidase subunit 1
MSSVATLQHGDVHGAHDAHHEHHHHETFISKYVFSQDHKMIAKQFLVTGIIWAIIGGLFSVVFRLQLGYPKQPFHGWKTCWAIGQQAVS